MIRQTLKVIKRLPTNHPFDFFCAFFKCNTKITVCCQCCFKWCSISRSNRNHWNFCTIVKFEQNWTVCFWWCHNLDTHEKMNEFQKLKSEMMPKNMCSIYSNLPEYRNHPITIDRLHCMLRLRWFCTFRQFDGTKHSVNVSLALAYVEQWFRSKISVPQVCQFLQWPPR